jgi:hypothetical protein
MVGPLGTVLRVVGTASWDAMPLGASLVGLAFAGYSAILIIQEWFGVSPADLPRPHRTLLGALFRKSVADQGRKTNWVGLSIAVLFVGVVGLIGLSIPVQFVANPSWVAANGIDGQLSGLLCLVAFAVWTAYALIVFGRALQAPAAASSIEAEAAPSGAPAGAAKLVVRSELNPKDCAQAIRDHLRAAVRRETSEDRLRDCAIAEAPDGTFRVAFLYWSKGFPVERQRPGRVQAWLRLEPRDTGSSVWLSIATRTQLSLMLSRWFIPAAILACVATALLVPYVATPFAFVGSVASVAYVASVVVGQVVRPRLIRECRSSVRSLCAAVQGVAEIDRGDARRIPGAAWNDVGASDLVGTRIG